MLFIDERGCGNSFLPSCYDLQGPCFGKGMDGVVDAGLSSLYTTDSVTITCSSISFRRGKNESTIESSIP